MDFDGCEGLLKKDLNLLVSQGSNKESMRLHNSVADQMLLNNTFDHLWCRISIPNAFGIDQQDRTVLAYT